MPKSWLIRIFAETGVLCLLEPICLSAFNSLWQEGAIEWLAD
jgi:hypothetical protein